ncbi:unnamed protein product [Hydatigera taeniaeformis]|uniref:Uncharacterized protein n=1 Tax=Hydatigena taeniaeformis TaxID=6205 RepID=A0A3P7F651_HYDTA|nr:unnamed protein product [Hydatigera taeniaeformis]
MRTTLDTEMSVIEGHIEEMRRARDRLKAALVRQTPVAEEKARIIERLENLLNKSETAVQTAQKAVRNAKQQLEDLKGKAFKHTLSCTTWHIGAYRMIESRVSKVGHTTWLFDALCGSVEVKALGETAPTFLNKRCKST